ncbi:MAG: 50S ribosomal protein L6 [Candidatus Gottesmanbacteria bacterium]
MSRIGKTPIEMKKEITVAVDGSQVVVKGPKGQLFLTLPANITVVMSEKEITIECTKHDTKYNALHGFVRAELANMINGVTVGWTKTLELAGVGYRAAMSGSDLVLSVGFSHQVTITPPAGITIAVVEGKIVVSGIDKQAVGQIAANIREVRKPEPYKGKGIKYVGEYIRRKAGKSAKAIGGAATGAK